MRAENRKPLGSLGTWLAPLGARSYGRVMDGAAPTPEAERMATAYAAVFPRISACAGQGGHDHERESWGRPAPLSTKALTCTGFRFLTSTEGQQVGAKG